MALVSKYTDTNIDIALLRDLEFVVDCALGKGKINSTNDTSLENQGRGEQIITFNWNDFQYVNDHHQQIECISPNGLHFNNLNIKEKQFLANKYLGAKWSTILFVTVEQLLDDHQLSTRKYLVEEHIQKLKKRASNRKDDVHLVMFRFVENK